LSDDLRELVRQSIDGDQSAMQAIVARYEGQVFGLCYRMLGHRQDAEDAAQETFVRVLKSLHRWDAARDFEPWLLAIAGNRCRTALSTRQRKPAPQTLVTEVPETHGENGDADCLAEEIHLALQNVKPQYRQAFILFQEQELSYQEIADAMSCPIGTIKTWVHRVRKELVQRLRRREVIQDKSYAM